MTDTNRRPFVTGVTIDGPTSLDLDDAILLQKKEKGWIATISISDVAAHVMLGSEADLRALERGFTRYFSSSNHPMLSRHLGEDRLSLLPRKRRDVLAFVITLSEDHVVENVEVKLATAKTMARMSHADVDKILDDKSHKHHAQWAMYYSFAEALLNKRRREGAFVIYDFEKGYYTNEEGQVVKRAPGQFFRAYIIVQEFMILANTTVSQMLSVRGVHMLYRNHETASSGVDRASLMREFYGEDLTAETFAFLMDRLQGFLKRARLEAVNKGHFGLNLPTYARLTSPIRRYDDLVNHRILRAWIAGAPNPYSMERLTEIGDHLNRLADNEKARTAARYKAEDFESLQKASPEEVVAFDEGKFSRFVKCIVEEQIPLTEARLGAMKQKLGMSSVLVDKARILFIEAPDKPHWHELKLFVFQLLVARPVDVLQIVHLGTGHGYVSDIVVTPAHADDVSGTNMVARGKVGSRMLTTKARSASTRAEAERNALIALVAMANGLDEGSTLWSTPAPKQAVVRDVLQVASAPESPSEATVHIAGHATTALVQAICGKAKIAQPQFLERSAGPPHNIAFFAIAFLEYQGTKIETKEVAGGSKREARHKAIAELLPLLPKDMVALVGTAATPVVQGKNPVSVLMELAQAGTITGLDFKYQHMGPHHAREFECTCSFSRGQENREFVAKGASKNEAKAKAAQLACSALVK